MKGILVTREDFKELANGLYETLSTAHYSDDVMKQVIEEYFNDYYSEVKTEIAQAKKEKEQYPLDESEMFWNG